MVRVGMVGCGGISRMYCDLYAELVDVAQVTAVADPVTELAVNRAAAMREAYGAEAHAARYAALESRDDAARERLQRRARAAAAAAAVQIPHYRDHEHLLREAEVDALVVLTAPPVRREPTVAAAQAGKHVFIQGPMATNVADADAMVAAVQAAGVQFHSQCGARYPRDMVLARRAVESGALGAMGSARVELNWFRGPGLLPRLARHLGRRGRRRRLPPWALHHRPVPVGGRAHRWWRCSPPPHHCCGRSRPRA